MYKTRLMTVRPSQTIDHVQSRPSLQAEWAHLSPQGHHDLAWPRLQRVVVRMCEEEIRNSKKKRASESTICLTPSKTQASLKMFFFLLLSSKR